MRNDDTNSSSRSTTFEWKKVKISDGKSPRRVQPGDSRSAKLLRERRLQEPLTINVRYRGGPEARWEIRSRGIVRTYPGHWYVHDVLADIYAERWSRSVTDTGGPGGTVASPLGRKPRERS